MAMFGLALCFILFVTTLGQDCTSNGMIGKDRQQGTPQRLNMFYLDTDSQASCRGVVTGFSYSFFAPQTGISPPSTTAYEMVFALYRQTGTSNSFAVYSAVSDSFVATQPISQFDGQGTVFSATLPLSTPLTVEVGDVLGACVSDPQGESTFRLDVVGTSSSALDMLWFTSSDQCTNQNVPSSFMAQNRIPSLLLHLHATIEPFPEDMTTTIGPVITIDPVSTMEPISTMDPAGTTESVSTMDPVSTTESVGTMDPVITMESVGPTEPTGSVGTTDITDTGNSSNSTTTIPTSDAQAGGTAAAVIVVFFILLALVCLTVGVIVIVLRRRKESYVVSKRNPISQANAISYPLYEFDDEVCASTDANTNQSTMDNPTYQPQFFESPIILCYSALLEKNKEEDIYANESSYEIPASREDDIYAQLKSWGIQHIRDNELEIVGHLGSGQFGSVEQGVWKREGTGPVDVALKSLTKTSQENKVKFLQEAAIMAQFRHPNVIKMWGVVSKSVPLKLVTELAAKGDLRKFLISFISPGETTPTGAPEMLLKFSQQVALGMQYLSAKGFVHRDLAARNVLVTKNNICKVADFGMSRDLADENIYISQGKDKIPVKWTAPEALHYKNYSTASDVWSYGCLLYEIWSLGNKPFSGLKNIEAVKQVDLGRRLAPPPGCPKFIYELMMICWHPETSQRPSFRDIVLTLVSSKEMILSIPEEDSSTNPLAGVLGAPLEVGENMYPELQRSYNIV